MELKDVKDYELKDVSLLYDEFKKNNEWYKGDSLDFVVDYLNRCTCCDKIHFDSDLMIVNNAKVCEECKEYLSDEEEVTDYTIDAADEYFDRLLESEEM